MLTGFHPAREVLLPNPARVKIPTMLHELWQYQDLETGASCNTFILAGAIGAEIRGRLPPHAVLTWTCEADSYIQAMNAYYAHLGWGEYRPMLDEHGNPYATDLEPYPEAWVATERSS
jgi:hypothetical protein